MRQYNNETDEEESINSPDEEAARGIKGFLLWLVAYSIITVLISGVVGGNFNPLVITTTTLAVSLMFISPGAVGYLVGVYQAYLWALKRIK